MIKLFLSEAEDHDSIFKKLRFSKKARYYEICNEIDREKGEFIVAASILPEEIGSCCITKLHFQDGLMVLDESTMF